MMHDPDRNAGTRPELPHTVEVAGVEVRYGVTGDGERDILLVHGHAAHHRWWYRVAPRLAEHSRVIALDLSGHGDSGHRTAYDASTWGEELLAVLAEVGSRRPVVVGHSLGGRLGLLTSVARPDAFAGLAMLDAPLLPPPSLRERATPSRPPARRLYPSREEAVTRFRLMPSQRHPAADVMTTIAEYSVREVAGGWTWKHDHRGFPTLYGTSIEDAASLLSLPLAYVYGGESGLVDDDALAFVRATIRSEVRMVRIPGAAHHLPLDAPEACALAVREFTRTCPP